MIMAVLVGLTPLTLAAPNAANDARIRQRTGAQRYQLQNLDLPKALPDSFIVTVDCDGEPLDLLLERHDVRAPDYQLMVYRDGKCERQAAPEPRTYRGVALGDTLEADVAASLTEQGLSATIVDQASHRVWTVAPMRGFAPANARAEHVVYANADVELPGTCGMTQTDGVVDDLDLIVEPLSEPDVADATETSSATGSSGVSIAALDENCTVKAAQIAFDMDNGVYSKYGNVADAQARIDQHVNTLTVYYSRDALITYELTGAIFRETPFYDFEAGGLDNGQMLDEFKNKWQSGEAGNSGFEYDFGHLITSHNNGNVIGLAWVNSVCSTLRYGWAIDNVDVMAHEIGHNWGLGHCNDNGDCRIMCSGIGGCDHDSSSFGLPSRTQLLAREASCVPHVAGTASPAVPPRTVDDKIAVNRGELSDIGTLLIDALANDYDGNCDLLQLDAYDALSLEGAVLGLSIGTGTNGADELSYTPGPSFMLGRDYLHYTIGDGNGSQAAGIISVEPKTSSLVGYWKLDETSTTVANDSSGFDQDGSVQGSPTRTTGYWGNSISFDGVDDVVILPRVVQDDFTIAFWMKTTQAVGANNAAWWDGRGLVDAEVAGYVDDFGVSLTGSRIAFGVRGTTIHSNINVNDGQWRHITATRSATDGVLKIYVNGALQQTGTSTTASLTAPDRITLGMLQTEINYYAGLLDDVRIYNDVLEPTEIVNLINGLGKAYDPQPRDGDNLDLHEPVLQWATDTSATTHLIYLGTNYAAVRDATSASPELIGASATGQYTIPQPLINGQVYYWRVDQLSGLGTAAGDVWVFRAVADPDVVAYWRFEVGPGAEPVAHTTGSGVYDAALVDSSGNGNHLSAWSVGGCCGEIYRADKPTGTIPRNGASNRFSLSHSGDYPGLFTSSTDSEPLGVDLQTITPAQWTVEAYIRVDNITDAHTIVGRDGSNVATSDAALSPFKFQTLANGVLSATFVDGEGRVHTVESLQRQIRPLTWANVAVSSDGETLRLYVNASEVASAALPTGDTSLAKASDDDAWTVFRAMDDEAHVDRWYGRIDEVRISTAALDPTKLLYTAVVCPEDIDGDTVIYTSDFYALLEAFGAGSADGNWNPDADLDDSSVVDVPDFAILQTRYGQSCY